MDIPKKSFISREESAPKSTLKRSQRINPASWIMVALKLGPKFSKIGALLLKVIKGGGLIKSGLATASVGFYTLLFSWQMAVGLVLFLLIHEYGHMWAMKRCGMKTRGMYLIPGFGAIALAGEHWKSARDEAFIAIMGPLFGFFFLVPAIILYYLTGNPLFPTIAAFTAFINLLNLFPINPLDGGRIIKSILYSLKSSLGLLSVFLSLGIAVLISVKFGFFLLAYIALIGAYETLLSYGLLNSLWKLFKTFLRILAAGFFIFVWTSWNDLFATSSILRILVTAFDVVLCGVVIIAVIADVITAASSEKRPELKTIAAYPVIIILDVLRGVKELFSLKASDLAPIENYPPMPRKTMLLYTLYYILTAASMACIIAYTSALPGLEGAKELLK